MDSSIDIARKYGDKHELALILPNYADLLLEDGQIEQAILILEEADGLAQKYKKQVAAQSVAGIYSDYYTSIGDLNNAYRYTIKAYRIAEELNQELISFGSYVRMCESHFYSGRIDSTFFYLEKITTLTEQLQIPFMVLLSNYYSGRYHFYNGDHKSSVEHFNFIIENIPDDFDLSMRVVPKAFNAINYKNMDQPKRSLEYMDMIKNEIGKDDKFEEMEYYNILIQALEKNNEQDLAKKYLLDAYDIIMQRSFKIKDRQLRNDFLEKNYWNLKILTLYNNLAS